MLVLVSARSSNQGRCFFGTIKYLHTILRGGKIYFLVSFKFVLGRNSKLIFNSLLLHTFFALRS